MKATILAIILLINLSCKSQHHKTETMNTGKDKQEIEKMASILKKNDSVMMKNGRLDIAALIKKGIPSTSSTPTEDEWKSSISYEYEKNLSNSLYVQISGNELSGYSKTTRVKNNQFEIYSEYYPSGETKQIGELYSNEFTKGTWYWFSESGKIDKYKDYDAPFKFSLEEVQLFLKKNKVAKQDINQIGRAIQDDLPLWYISFKTKELEGTDNVQQYILNGTTGKVIKKELLDISRALD